MGVLYVAVVAMWALVMVPAYLKRHDRLELERSMRKPLTEQLRSRASLPQRAPMPARQRAFIRRRRVMMALLTSIAATGLGAIAGTIPAYWVALPVAALGAFIAAAVRYGHAAPVAQPFAYEPIARTATIAQPLSPEHSWRPVETPLPSYLTAARAPQAPGSTAWTSADMLASAAARKAEIEQKLIAAQVNARHMRDLTKERAMRSAAAAEQARNRAVGE